MPIDINYCGTSIPGTDQLFHQASEERGLERLDAVIGLRFVLTEGTHQALWDFQFLSVGESGLGVHHVNPQLKVERERASKLRTQRLARCAGRHIFGTPTRTDIEFGCTFTPCKNYVR